MNSSNCHYWLPRPFLRAPCTQEKTVTPLTIVSRGEPGQPIVVSGRMYNKGDCTPVRQASLNVYHTDAAGYYSRPSNDPGAARINAWAPARTDGSYAFSTILPGHYVVDNSPARHIHVHLSAPGVADHWIDSFLFAGDQLIRALGLHISLEQVILK